MTESKGLQELGFFNKANKTIKVFDKNTNNFKDIPATAIHGYDVDGTLSFPNENISPWNIDFIKELQNRFGVVGILSSGKSMKYLENQAKPADIAYWFAENHAVYQQRGKEPVVLGENLEELFKLRHIIGLGPRQEGVSTINLLGRKGEVAIEEGKIGVLTIFPEAGPVMHRWDFKEKYNRKQVTYELRKIIKAEKLKLSVLEPHGDGAVDVVRLDKYNRPIDKTSFQSLCEEIFTGKLNMAFFGDGTNDLPAMLNSEIAAITFSNAPREVQIPVNNKGFKGYIAPRPGPEGGLFQGVIWLAKSGFYGTNKQAKAIRQYGEEYLENYLDSKAKIFSF
jgi:hydroxymethylpyrimidine pyrophosphatase-like HAD family hydrolase